jgi:tetratricopeptide (TPR) repeat protein
MPQVTSLTSISEHRLRRLVLGAALVLLVAIPVVVVGYLLDQQVQPGLSMPERRLGELEAAAKERPDDIGLRLTLADAYLEAGRPQDAFSQYDAVIVVAPANMKALLGKAGILEAAGDLAAAPPLDPKAVDLAKGGEFAASDTGLERAYFGLGSVAVKAGRFADAITALESAARIDGTDADAWNLLGQAQLGAGNAVKAIQAERNAVTFVPMGWSEPYETMGKAYVVLGQAPGVEYAQAMVDFVAKRNADARQRLLPLLNGPAAADAALGLGMIAETDGDATGAVSWYRKALELRPGNETAIGGLDRLGASEPASSGGPASGGSASDAPAAGG